MPRIRANGQTWPTTQNPRLLRNTSPPIRRRKHRTNSRLGSDWKPRAGDIRNVDLQFSRRQPRRTRVSLAALDLASKKHYRRIA